MQMLVNGNWVASASGELIGIFNPANGELIDSVPRARRQDIDTAVTFAKKGYLINRSLSAKIRHEYLVRAGNLLLEHLDELRASMIAENGKSWQWADFEIKKSAEILITIADRAKD